MAQVDVITVLDHEGIPREVATLSALAKLFGEQIDSPTAFSLLDRIKQLDVSVDAVKAAVDLATTALTAGSVAQLGARTIAQSPAVNIATDQPSIPVDQKSVGHDVQVTLTRPNNTTLYTSGDVVGQTADGRLTFPGMAKTGGGSILITRAELELDISAVPAGMTTFRLYLYSSAPPSNIADNAAFTWTGTDRGPFLGWLDLGNPVLIGGTLYCKVSSINEQMKLTSADLFAYLVTTAGYQPAAVSEVYKITLHSVDV